jgi:hypothetical protein
MSSPHLQITRAKWTGCVTQTVQCLPKALSSNPSPIKKKKRKENLKKEYKENKGNDIKETT